MTTETVDAPEAVQEEQKVLAPIWGEVNGRPIKIPVLGLTGPYSSGKTLWGLQIDPENTLMFDFEKSAASYEGIGVTPIDVPAEMLKAFPDPDAITGLQYFNWMLDRIRQIPPGKYSVIMIDTIGDAEKGLVDYTAERYASHGEYTSPESFKKMKGVFWAAVKDNWQRIINEISSRCQTFVFTAHLQDEWVDGRATGKKVPQGKDTLMKLASLYLRLSREDVKPSGQRFETRKPWAVRIKGRLVVFGPGPGLDIVPVLPSKIKECDPNRIRHFIQNPADLKKASQNAIPNIEPAMSEDEKIRLQARTAEDNLKAAEVRSQTAGQTKELRDAALERMRIEKEASKKLEEKFKKQAEMKPEVPVSTDAEKPVLASPPSEATAETIATSTGSAKGNVKVGGSPSPQSEPEAKVDSSPGESAPIEVNDTPEPSGESGRFTLEDLLELKALVVRKQETWDKALKGYGAATPEELTSTQIDHLADRLSKRRQQMIDKGELENWAEKSVAKEEDEPLKYTVKELQAAKRLHVSKEGWKAYLEEYEVTSGKQLTPRQVSELCERILTSANPDGPAPEQPNQVPLNRDEKSNWGNAAAAGN